MNPLLQGPLDTSLQACLPTLLEPLRKARLFITGSTGFFGGWVLRAIARLNVMGYGIRAECVSRDPQKFLARNPDLAEAPHLRWLSAEAQQFAALRLDPETTHVLHMAASTDAAFNLVNPLDIMRVAYEGTSGCIALARRYGARLHFGSSGAVYGQRHFSDGPAKEDQVARFAPDPLNPQQAYGNAKRMAESLLASGLDNYVISRPFAFLGPLLPLDTHFAAGNFVADAHAKRPIRISGDGTPIRSYMHPADLAVWLLVLTGRTGSGDAFNVGSDATVSIADLAREVRRVANSQQPQQDLVSTPGANPSAYWPDVSKAMTLGLRVHLSLAQSIQNTLDWTKYQAAHQFI